LCGSSSKFRDRGRLDDLAHACEIAGNIAGEPTGPAVAEALLLDDRFGSYSHADVMDFALASIGTCIITADFTDVM
jgi:hypothetical protein